MKQRKDGRWCKGVTLPTGKKKYFYSTAKTEKAAKKDLEHQMLLFHEKEERGETFKKVADRWETEHYENLEYYTMRRYSYITKNIVAKIGHLSIREITPQDIKRYGANIASYYSVKTVKDYFSVLRMIFKYAYVNAYIDENIMLNIDTPKGIRKKKRDALSEESIKTVNNSTNCTFGIYAYFLLYTGLRKGEALALQWQDIDFDNNQINVTKSVCYTGYTPSIKSTKTEAGIRTVPLLESVKKHLLSMPGKHKKTDYIFSGSDKPISDKVYQKRWKTYQSETGITETAHCFRHTYATILSENDIDVKTAQVLLGHSDITTTQNIYTHVRQKKLNDAANKLNNLTNF
jgi:integrase